MKSLMVIFILLFQNDRNLINQNWRSIEVVQGHDISECPDFIEITRNMILIRNECYGFDNNRYITDSLIVNRDKNIFLIQSRYTTSNYFFIPTQIKKIFLRIIHKDTLEIRHYKHNKAINRLFIRSDVKF